MISTYSGLRTAPGDQAEKLERDGMMDQSLKVRVRASNGGEPARKGGQRTVGIGAFLERIEQEWNQRLKIVIRNSAARKFVDRPLRDGGVAQPDCQQSGLQAT
jgi:hypothetical protein